MAELDLKYEETPGILKEIDEGAMDLVFQAIQEDIYSYPIKSFVREAVSNGLDAVAERDIHRKIQNGDPVDKYYRQLQDGALLKDSEYNPKYYDEKYLSHHNKVDVYYDMPVNSRRHLIRIQDRGVGLGGERLKGFFRIGYSSKRNMKDVFGKFGAGAKAGLATGVDFFMMKTVYNGYKTSFMIYKTDYEAVTPKSDTTKTEVWSVKMINGDTAERKIYWEETSELNGVTIELEVKPHNERAFKDAVLSQFQHFNGKVKFHYKYDSTDTIFFTNDLNVQPLYNSDVLLIPEYSSYYVPTILVDGINYGPIAWPELEMEDHKGTICIKSTASDVDITQSRESLKWTEKTKKFILNAIEKAEKEATEYLGSKLDLVDPHDLITLVTKYRKLDKGADNVTSTFAKFLNKTNVKPTYEFKPDWMEEDLSFPAGIKRTVDQKLWELFFEGFNVRRVRLKLTDKGVRVNTEELYNFDDVVDSIVVFANYRRIGPKTAYKILEEYNRETFVYISTKTLSNVLTHDVGGITLNSYHIVSYVRQMMIAYSDVFLDEYTYTEDNVKDEELENAELEVDPMTLAELRRQNNEVLYHKYHHWGSQTTKYTVKISEIKNDMDAYGFDKEHLCIATQDFRGWGDFLRRQYGDKILIIYVSRKHVREFLPYGTFITDFIYTVEDGVMKLGEHVKRYAAGKVYFEAQCIDEDYTPMNALLKFFSPKLDNSDVFNEISYYQNCSIPYEEYDTFIDTLILNYKRQLAGNKDENVPTIVDLYDPAYVQEIIDVIQYTKPVSLIIEYLPYHSLDDDMKKELEFIINAKKELQ